MVASDASAVAEAVLRGDLDEARLRTHLLASRAGSLEMRALSAAAQVLGLQLGPMGGRPNLSYGAGLLQVAEELRAALGDERFLGIGGENSVRPFSLSDLKDPACSAALRAKP